MSRKSVKLSAKWQLDAALLSRPVDLTALVTMSRSAPMALLEENTLHRLVTILLNEKNERKSDKDTKLDVLNILANVASEKKAVGDVRTALQGVSEWFDEYIASEEEEASQEPELHKAMVLLLARCYEYKIKTEDVLELTAGKRRIALCTVVGLLEDGETYTTELRQRQAPGQGQMAQWEHELVCQRYERPLLLQICRLLRGFTHPGTYFEAGSEVALHSVEKFALEMTTLLEITIRSRLVEKLAVALYDCLFSDEAREDRLNTSEELDDEEFLGGATGGTRGGGNDGDGENDLNYRDYLERVDVLEDSDHLAAVSVHAFLQNLYFYASEHNEEFRNHMLVDTLLIPRLVLPYLDRSVQHAMILNHRAEAYSEVLSGDAVAQMALHKPNLVKGIAASLRTLILASFRAPATQFVMSLLRRLNPTTQMLKATTFCMHHEYIFALLCLLNVNMGALDLSARNINDVKDDGNSADVQHAHALLHQLASVYELMEPRSKQAVYKRVSSSGALPISRDTPSYVAVMSMLHGGAAGQLEYVMPDGDAAQARDDGEEVWDPRAEAKRAHAERMAAVKMADAGDQQKGEITGYAAAVAVSAAADKLEREQQLHAEAKDSSNVDHDINRSKGMPEDSKGIDNGNNKPKSSSLLGDLPSLNKAARPDEVRMALELKLPGELPKQKVGASPPDKKKSNADPTIPKEFLCAINEHVMKDPVRARTSGLCFERATIDLWLATRGSVCPITNAALQPTDLEAADDLKNQIMRYHIQQTSMRVMNNADDDLYDF